MKVEKLAKNGEKGQNYYPLSPGGTRKVPAARFSAGVAFGFRHPSPWERFAFWRWYRSSSACSYTSVDELTELNDTAETVDLVDDQVFDDDEQHARRVVDDLLGLLGQVGLQDGDDGAHVRQARRVGLVVLPPDRAGPRAAARLQAGKISGNQRDHVILRGEAVLRPGELAFWPDRAVDQGLHEGHGHPAVLGCPHEEGMLTKVGWGMVSHGPTETLTGFSRKTDRAKNAVEARLVRRRE